MGWVSPFWGWVSSSSVLQGVLARQGHDVIAFMQSSMWVQVVLKLAQRTERGTVLDYLLSLRQSFRFLGYIPSSRIVGLYSSFFFNFWEPPHCFHSDCANLHSHQQCTSGPFSPRPRQPLSLGSSRSNWWGRCLIEVSVFISLVINDVRHLFIYLLAICRSSLKICLFRSFAYFKIAWFVLVLMSSLYILDIYSLSDIWYASIFSHFICCLFILLMVSFAVHKFFSLT